MRKEITIKNPTRSRKWGWGWSCTPAPNSSSIPFPTVPDVTGTFKQIREYVSNDRTYASVRSGGGFTSQAIFYDNQRVVGWWGIGLLEPGRCDCSQSCDCYWAKGRWGEAFWQEGSVYDEVDGSPLPQVKILVEVEA